MAYPKGKPRPVGSGRKIGSVNKKNLMVREALEDNNMNLIQMLSDVFPQLKPSEKASTLVQIMPYVYPRLTSVTHTGDKDNPIIVEFMKKSIPELIELASKEVVEDDDGS